jgi:hypothetical protein
MYKIAYFVNTHMKLVTKIMDRPAQIETADLKEGNEH